MTPDDRADDVWHFEVTCPVPPSWIELGNVDWCLAALKERLLEVVDCYGGDVTLIDGSQREG